MKRYGVKRCTQRATGRRVASSGLSALSAILCVSLLGGMGAQAGWEEQMDARLAKLRAAGEPVTFEEGLAQRRSVPDEENAALVLLRAFPADGTCAVEPPPGQVRELSAPSHLGWRDHAAARRARQEWLARHADLLAAIHRAAELPGGGFPLVPTESPVAVRMPHKVSLRESGRLVAVEAVCRAQEGDAAAAGRSLVAGRRLSASMGTCVMPREVLIRLWLDRLFVDALERVTALCVLPGEDLARLRVEIARELDDLSLTAALRTERALTYRMAIIGMQEEPEEDAKADLLPEQAPHAGEVGWYLLEAHDSANLLIEASMLPDREALIQLAELEEQAEALREFRQYSYPMSPAGGPVLGQVVRTRTQLMVADVALALEQWRIDHPGQGPWAQSLDALVPAYMAGVPDDPYSDAPLRYARTDEGAVVYSLGPDRTDNGGHSWAAEREDEKEGWGGGGWDISCRLLNEGARGARELSAPGGPTRVE